MKFVHLSFVLLLASLLTGIKGQCQTELKTLFDCAYSVDGFNVQQPCQACVENGSDFITADCDELESTFCSKVENCKTTCEDCADELEAYAYCLLVDSKSDCDPICGSGSSGGSGGMGNVLGSFFTVFFLGLASLLWV